MEAQVVQTIFPIFGRIRYREGFMIPRAPFVAGKNGINPMLDTPTGKITINLLIIWFLAGLADRQQ